MIPYPPEWVFKLLVVLAAIGGIAVIVGVIAGIVWLINHVRIV